MPPRALSANSIAVAAGVNRSWVYRALEIGVISEPCFPADAIVLRVYRLVSQFVWPDRPRQRSVKHEIDTWQLAALNAARDAVGDKLTTAETTLYVLQSKVFVANTRLERAALESRSDDGEEPSDLDAETVLRLPIGRWIDELPSVIAKIPKSAPRRSPIRR